MELADEVKELLEQRRIEMGHARALLGLTSRRQQIEVADWWPRSPCRCGKPRHWCAASWPRRRPIREEPPAADPDIQRLERELADKLGAKVAVPAHRFRQGQAGRELQQLG